VAYDRDRLPQPAQVAELLKERRTVRKFKARKLERPLLAEIVGYAACAPTNNYALRAIVVDDPAIILALDAIIMRYSSWIYTLCFRYRPLFALLRRLSPSVSHKQKVKMKRGLERGHSFDTAPAAQVYIVGDRRVLLSEISAHYALYSMILYAQANGVGSRIKSARPLVLDRNKTARRWLGLQAHEHILATLDLGYPAVRFSNKVEGKYLPLTWNGRQPND
jgi:nitroreductase